MNKQAKKTFNFFIKWRKCWACGAELRESEETVCYMTHINKQFYTKHVSSTIKGGEEKCLK